LNKYITCYLYNLFIVVSVEWSDLKPGFVCAICFSWNVRSWIREFVELFYRATKSHVWHRS